ncbi:hypothetical protein [Metabacillus sediminilitoris]|uniref:VOC domain-containing protein n=1 Tax=Metabacillus sediminilitoris TaxID=2567941 RepID=A0A4S4BK38_9BACI|nr:hypothetical protein [Metabacillus sediminilitoris]QGQ45857.1 hypothetical protein GMB29_11805 [Metabacillus sediminilitoris]THF74978.1 hypothetical protein E6W99_24585 [Metabacillus sediminilitoris]
MKKPPIWWPFKSTLILTHNAKCNEEVKSQSENAGGSIVKEGVTDDGSYTGYFKDPNGHVWEVIAWDSEH